MKHWFGRVTWIGIPLVLLAAGCAAEASPDAVGASDAALFAAEPDLPSDAEAALLGARGAALDRLFTIDHYVPVGRGRWIHLRETFSPRAWLTRHRHAVLMLSGPIVDGEFYEIDADGYRGRSRLASHGVFAFTADFEGSGESSYPADGRSPSHASQVEAMQTVIRYIRLVRGVPRVDVLGESWGGGVAAELCADATRVRSCVLASMIYRTPTAFADATFRSPFFRAFLDSVPDGYIVTDASTYAGLLAASPPEVQDWVGRETPGRYTMVPLYDVFDLPFFDPTRATVPGLLVQGELDPNQPLSDSEELAASYGGGMSLVVVEGGGHIPRIEAPPANERWWSAVEDFLAY